MLPLKKYGIFAAAWISFVLSVLCIHYISISAYNKAQIDEKITLVVASHFNLSQLVDNLPTVFRENPHAAALRLTDLRGVFLGAMYDSRRMSTAHYKTFIDGPGAQTIAGYETHIWESKRRRLRIYTASLPRMQLGEYLAIMGRDYSLHYLIPLYLSLGILALVGWHFFTSRRTFSVRPLRTTITKAETAPASKQIIQPWRIGSGNMAASDIKSTLENLLKEISANRVTLYSRSTSRKHSAWRGILEIRGMGSLAIRGADIIPDNLLEQSRDPKSDYVVSPDSKHAIFFDTVSGEAQLAFAIKTESRLARTPFEISEMVKAMSRNILIQHRYEHSILDEDTGLYSAPYATFTLKEKILAGLPFALAALRVENRDIFDKVCRTTIRILREAYSAEEAPIVAHFNQNTILIIYQAIPFLPKKSADTFARIDSACRGIHSNFASAMIKDAAGLGSASRALALVEKRLNNREANLISLPV